MSIKLWVEWGCKACSKQVSPPTDKYHTHSHQAATTGPGAAFPLAAFIADVRRVWHNCACYNPARSLLATIGRLLAAIFEANVEEVRSVYLYLLCLSILSIYPSVYLPVYPGVHART